MSSPSQKFYAAIDLKAFYASVECQERGLDPLDTHLVVADESRTEKTICPAISPSLKKYGLPGRARLFEVLEKIRSINYDRRNKAPSHKFTGKSSSARELAEHPEYELDIIIATPRMQHYLNYSQKIYQTYLSFVAPEDIFAYSIDEIFCDITSYLKIRNYTPEDFVTKMVSRVYELTGITATAGIGTNLYLAKIAMDIIAKHSEPNKFGARIAYLDEKIYREKLWAHQPISDFWRVGPGISKRLRSRQMYTMGDVARCSLINEDLLFHLLGVNAELLIDHAWGIEPTTISDIKNYRPEVRSLSNGQVLSRPYEHHEASTIIKEMSDQLALALKEKDLKTDQLVLHITYDHKSKIDNIQEQYELSNIKIDRYGHLVPKPAHGTKRLARKTASQKIIRGNFLELFEEITKPNYLIRKINLTAGNLIIENNVQNNSQNNSENNFNKNTQNISRTHHFEQLDLFNYQNNFNSFKNSSDTQYNERIEGNKNIENSKYSQNITDIERDEKLENAILKIRKKYGNNSILSGANFEPGATGRERHKQIGGHRA